jgi:hypothetical protein
MVVAVPKAGRLFVDKGKSRTHEVVHCCSGLPNLVPESTRGKLWGQGSCGSEQSCRDDGECRCVGMKQWRWTVESIVCLKLVAFYEECGLNDEVLV